MLGVTGKSIRVRAVVGKGTRLFSGWGYPERDSRGGGGGVTTRGGNGPAAALGAQKMLGFLISPAQPRLFYL